MRGAASSTQAPTTSVLDEDNFVFRRQDRAVHLGGGTTVVCGTEAYRRHLFMLRVYCGLIFSRSSVRPPYPGRPRPARLGLPAMCWATTSLPGLVAWPLTLKLEAMSRPKLLPGGL